jgi:hypothetical protein
MWKNVEIAIQQGQPRVAITQLKLIEKSCFEQKAYPEAIRAMVQGIVLELQFEDAASERAILLLQKRMEGTPKSIRPILHTILANWYWDYFQGNRWRFQDRTQGGAVDSEGIATWDLKRIFDEIDRQHNLALQNRKLLQSTPIASYDALLEIGTHPDSCRPTLFDFIAYQAIDFYASGEQAAAKPVDSFEIDASSAALGTTDDFLAWNPQTTDEDSTKLKAIRLFQELIRFHDQPNDRDARLHAELERIRFVASHAVGEEKGARVEALLDRFAKANENHPMSALALARLAESLMGRNEFERAFEVAKQGENAFPKSIGGAHCHNICSTITFPSLDVLAERVWNAPASSIRVRYKNVSKVHFRIVQADWEKRLAGNGRLPSEINDSDSQSLLSQNPIKAWTADLEPTTDFQEATHEVVVPGDLPSGYYYLLYSMDESFRGEGNQVGVTDFWVSKLAIVVRKSWVGSTGDSDFPVIEGMVLDNQTGEPIGGATVQRYVRDIRSGIWMVPNAVTTQPNGMFQIASKMRTTLLLVKYNGELLATTDWFNQFREPLSSQSEGVVLFTDRSIYRPGQTIHFKGVATKLDPSRDIYLPITGRTYEIELKDPHGQVVEVLELRTNDYGSISGSFTIPRDRGTGRMFLSVGDGSRLKEFRVEEYKRPKFQVTIDPIKDEVKLLDSVQFNGHALGYTGVPVQGADVRYRVVRRVRCPSWFESMYAWRIQPFSGPEQEIAQGWTKTRGDGSFQIQFVARPDAEVPEDLSPIFQYEVIADVTDGTGETRTGSRVASLGYVTTQVTLSAESWQVDQQSVEFKVHTTNLNDEDVKGKGVLKVYRVIEPNEVPRSDLLGVRIRPVLAKPRGRSNSKGESELLPGVYLRLPFPQSEPDPTLVEHWPLGELVSEQAFETDESGKASLEIVLKGGIYRAVVETQDAVGKPVLAEKNVRVLNLASDRFESKLPFVFASPKEQWQPGETWTGVWGTGYETGRAYVEVIHRDAILQAFWTELGKTQVKITQPITESMRGGFSVRVMFVRNNRLYSEMRVVQVPWTNKELTVRWERFRNKLEPGAKEKWIAKISGTKLKADASEGAHASSSRIDAEFAATLYDASLDAFMPHQWPDRIATFFRETSSFSYDFQNRSNHFQIIHSGLSVATISVDESYRRFPQGLHVIGNEQVIVRSRRHYRAFDSSVFALSLSSAIPDMAASPALLDLSAVGAMAKTDWIASAGEAGDAPGVGTGGGSSGGSAGNPGSAGLDAISPRVNLNETAFFFPQLITDADGQVTLEFTMPEALTKWKFLGLAHDKQLRSGAMIDTVVTAKDLMIQPNPPRFLREGDVIEFSAKVSNQSNQAQQGTVALQLFDAFDESSVDASFENTKVQQAFELREKESKTFLWRIRVPDGAKPIMFRAVAATDKISDGEQAMLPVISNKVLVRESMPLPMRGRGTKEFEFRKLIDSADSPTLRSQKLTLQMTSQPAWYAVLALPYLMEYPYECSEQTFNRMFANVLAQHIINSDPKITKVFENWRTLQPAALESPLSKNKDIQSILLEETPWVRDAQRETQARRNVGILFDNNRLQNETQSQWTRLAEMQRPSGMWPWFSGGPDDQYITLYITTGFGRLRQMGVKIDERLALRSIQSLDVWMHRMAEKINSTEAKDTAARNQHISSSIALYLYGRSFFLNDSRVHDSHHASLRFWIEQAKEHWVKLDRQSQAHLAVALKRFGDDATASAILTSFRERSILDEELGMYWKDQQSSWMWYRAPIETQAMVIEAFDEVEGDLKSVEACKVWLLKQKQTQDWTTTKATADAVYALLRRGTKLLASDALIEVKLADRVIEPEKVEAGTGFYETKFTGKDIEPQMGKVTVTKPDEGVSWGGLHWEYLEEIGKVTSHVDTPLKLEKQLFRRVLSDDGPKLEAIEVSDEPNKALLAKVGDELVCRVVLRVDREMDYVHLKDYRGSGTEPINVLSGYKFQDGIFYYESTRDTATHFFIDTLRRGTYVFEYSVRVQHAGEYPMGYAAIECMYAPEFRSHSAGITLRVSAK